ncbi:MAG: hypothetical protein COA69_07385 [Robiginitomaculum sp.]|nr:MAG: hypothetical protein COA69_07385 [Robiginitomaculum sp.]
MHTRTTRQYCAVLLTLLFLVIRGGSFAHAAQYGNNPHSHDGVMCTLYLAQDETDDLALPPAPTGSVPYPVAPFHYEHTDVLAQASSIALSYCARAPPLNI